MRDALYSALFFMFWALMVFLLGYLLLNVASDLYRNTNIHKVSFVVDSVERDIGSRNVYSYIHTRNGNVYEVNHMDTTKDYDLLVRKMTEGGEFDCEIQTYYSDNKYTNDIYTPDFVPTIIWCNYDGKSL